MAYSNVILRNFDKNILTFSEEHASENDIFKTSANVKVLKLAHSEGQKTNMHQLVLCIYGAMWNNVRCSSQGLQTCIN